MTSVVKEGCCSGVLPHKNDFKSAGSRQESFAELELELLRGIAALPQDKRNEAQLTPAQARILEEKMLSLRNLPSGDGFIESSEGLTLEVLLTQFAQAINRLEPGQIGELSEQQNEYLIAFQLREGLGRR